MRPMSPVMLVRIAPVTPGEFCLFMPLEAHALNYKGIVEAIKKSLYESRRRADILPLLPDPVITTY